MGHPDPESVPVRDAATVMLLRDTPGDAAGGFEVCLMQRNLQSDFVGGAYVFPGGGVDRSDADPVALARCVGRDDASASRLLDLGAGGLAFWVAAIRESFEEAGVLLARRADGTPVTFDEAGVIARFEQHRADVDAGVRRIESVCEQEDLFMDAGALHYFSRWITPLGAPRRYDTRFFVAAAPELQEVTHDDRELIGTHWMTPADALHRHEAGEFVLIFPTVRSLVGLTRFRHRGGRPGPRRVAGRGSGRAAHGGGVARRHPHRAARGPGAHRRRVRRVLGPAARLTRRGTARRR